jgi:hypothetical protein
MYRDFISFSYLILVFYELMKGKKFYVDFNIFTSYIFFVLFLLFLSFFDTGYRLYGSDIKVDTATTYISEQYVTLYVLRNAFLYIPVIFYYYLNRGIIELKFVENVFIAFIILLPFTMYYFTLEVFEVPLTFDSLLLFGQQYIPFNTYVPFLAFPSLISIYFLLNSTNLFLKFYSLLLFLLLFFYSFISSSRQSILFILVLLLHYLWNYKSFKVIFFGLIISILITSSFSFLLDNFDVNSEVIGKFVTREDKISESSRIGKISYGLSLLKPYEFFVGAGISSVPDGGPHNDFIRWIQRAGLFVGIYGFIPFLLLFINSISKIRSNRLHVFVLFSAFFTFFTSFFGYPRDDVFQSLFVFLGPILYYGLSQNKARMSKNLFS